MTIENALRDDTSSSIFTCLSYKLHFYGCKQWQSFPITNLIAYDLETRQIHVYKLFTSTELYVL